MSSNGAGGASVPGPLLASGVSSGVPWIIGACLLPVSLHILFPLYRYVQISNFHKDANHIGFGPTLMTSSYLITSIKLPLSQIRSHSYESGEGHNSLYSRGVYRRWMGV